MFDAIAYQIRRAWHDSTPLTAVCLLMFAAFLASFVGIFVDHRMITGVPAWLKPAKFGISSAIYAGTLAWLFRYIQIWPRLIRAAGWTTAIVLVLEVGIIDIQAARGITSHFNVATPLDSVLFGIMGSAIGALWLASVVVLVGLMRQRFSNAAWGWALRLGLLITVLGSASGGLMVRTTQEQMSAAKSGIKVLENGGHTVGAQDGGPGLPGIGWSRNHGDLRVPHFLGLHGVQLIPFLYWLASRRGRRPQISTMFAAFASYLGLVVILLWQALRGQSIAQPDQRTLIAFGLWLAGTIFAAVISRSSVAGGALPAVVRGE